MIVSRCYASLLDCNFGSFLICKNLIFRHKLVCYHHLVVNFLKAIVIFAIHLILMIALKMIEMA